MLLTVLGHISKWAGSAAIALQQWWVQEQQRLDDTVGAAPSAGAHVGDARARLEVSSTSRAG